MTSGKERSHKYREKNKEKVKEREKENSKRYRESKKNDETFKLKKSIKNRLYYANKKKQMIDMQLVESSGYNKRDTLLKKVREIKKKFPK